MLKKLVFILIISIPAALSFGQDKFPKPDNEEIGWIDYQGVQYLITADGIIRQSIDNQTNDFYTRYYREIYNDSTLHNPNYVMNSSPQVYISPMVNLSDSSKWNVPVGQGLYLFDFIEHNSQGQIKLLPGMINQLIKILPNSQKQKEN